MSISTTRARKLANHLLRENRKGRSYRVIAREDYGNIVSYAELNNIVLSKGNRLPKDEHKLIVLGLKKPRSPFAVLPKWYKRTPEALEEYNWKRERIKQMNKETQEELRRR